MMWIGTSVKVGVVEFAKAAHAHFTKHPQDHTYTTGEIACGELFAVRWAHCKATDTTWSVLVFEIGSSPVLVEEF